MCFFDMAHLTRRGERADSALPAAMIGRKAQWSARGGGDC